MRVLGGYRLERELGRGGMGVVHAALSPSGERCALKVLLDLDDEVALERFNREAHAARRLQHPSLVRVLDYGVAEGHPYLVMPLLEGSDLRDRLRSGPLPPGEVAEIGAALADGLAHAHALGILHRDLKPENVILTPRGPILTDFGLAKPLLDRQSLTQTGQLIGTPAYMAPEQARGDKTPIGVATDVYGLGALLYALLVGSAPFRGPTALMILTQVMESVPPPPSTLREGVPAGLEACVMRCLAKEPSQRFEDMVQLRDALSGASPLAAGAAGGGRGPKLGRAVLIALALASLMFLGTVASGLLRPPGPAPSSSPSPAPSSSLSPGSSPTAPTTQSPRQGRYGRDALRKRLEIPPSANAVDFVYDQVVVQLSSPRAFGLRWLEEGAELTKDPELRLAWALVLSQSLGDPASAAPICSELALSQGESPRLRVVRAFTQFRYADPAWVRAEMEIASADPAAPRYAIGLHALSLRTEGNLEAAIAVAEEGSRRGDPGSASVLATCHRRRLAQGSKTSLSEVLQAYARAEDLSFQLFDKVPIPWATNYAEIVYASGDWTKGGERFRVAITEATWTARPAILFAQALRGRMRANADPAQKKTLAREIREVLALAATRTSGVQQTRQLLLHGEEVGAPIEPALRGLAQVRLPLYERAQRADLVLEYLDQVGPEVWNLAYEDLNATIAKKKLDPAKRAQRLLARVRFRRRLVATAADRVGLDQDDRTDAKALEASGRDHDLAWAWVEFERGGVGLEPALSHLNAALAKNPENWPRLVALRAEIQLYLGRRGKSVADIKVLQQVAARRHPAERSRRARLCLLYLKGIHALDRGQDAKARTHLLNLNAASPPFYRRSDALRWEALCRARLGQRRLAAAAERGSYLSQLGLALELLREATLTKRRNRDFAALEDLAIRWPGPSQVRRWALELSEK